MDKIRNAEGKGIPHDVPYAVLVESNTPIVVQYSRLDTSRAEMALMTTIAYAVEETVLDNVDDVMKNITESINKAVGSIKK
jgi:hypothetical protein